MSKQKNDFYTGIKVIQDFQHFNELYKEGCCSAQTISEKIYPNQNLVLKSGDQQSALVVVYGDKLVLINDTQKYFGVTPKNKEQKFAMEMLNNKDIKLKILTGLEGVGKNFITAASLLEQVLEQKEYSKLVLTKTTDEVGKSLGLFPGTADEKFSNYMLSFRYTFANLLRQDTTYLDALMQKKIIEYIPIQLMRGISFPKNTIVWADEVAGLSPFELRMLGTRLEDDCALVLTGSFEQIDRVDKKGKRNKKEDTGLWKLINNEKVKNSGLASSIELIKNERSELSKLIADSL